MNTTSVTLKDMASILGVSISTVSKALKDKSDVSVRTKNKIKSLAKLYNYTPNNAALSLKSRKTNTIAVIVPKINNLVYGNILYRIQKHAHIRGYKVLIQQYLTYENGEFECVNSLRDGCVDGIIIIRTAIKDNFRSIDISTPLVVENVNDLSLNMQEYKGIGEKVIEGLFIKIDTLKNNSNQ